MSARRAALARAVDSVVDGTSDLDWGLMHVELDDERDRELLQHIRMIAQISDVQREEARKIDDASLRASARAIMRVLPPIAPSLVEEDGEGVAGGSTTRSLDLDEIPVTRWGRYELLERIGRGTFGEVYHAIDPQLQREVAIKLLHVRHSPEASNQRMLQEARALASVRHPNVVIVHDAEQRDGRVGLCMEYIRGRTLAEILSEQGPFSAGEAVIVGQALCQALSAVHAANLVHRDIKAQNVMREERGRVVLMDFGAGEPVSDGRPKSTRVIGTPSYLAPEVLEGEPATVRSDIYSLGILLFHLVTNDYPYRERTPAALIDAHRHGRVRRLRDLAPGLPSWFVQVIERAISLDPRARFATAGEFEAALTRKKVKIWPLLVAAGVTLAVATGVRQIWTDSRSPGAAFPLVAVLPLEAGLGVSAPHASAITGEIYQGLATIDTMRVVSLYSAAKAKRDNPTMTAIAKALGATAVVDGSVSDAADGLAVNLRLFRDGNEASDWAQTFRIEKAGFGSLRRDSVLSIANTLKVDVSPQALALLTRSPNLSSQAFDAYSYGRTLVERAGLGDLEHAIAAFERTIELEPAYAPAYAALARAHMNVAYGGPKSWSGHMVQARSEARKALDRDPTLAEAHVVLGQVAFEFDWDWKSADAAYRRAIEHNPSYDFARQCYSHFLAARGQVERAREELEEARRVNPLSDTNDLELVPVLQYEGRFPEAETLARSVLGRDPNVFQVYTQLGRIYAATGRYDQAIEQFLKLRDSVMGRDPYIDAEIASAHAGAGRVLEAEAILDRMHERARTEEVPVELFALVYTRLGRFDEAFHHLDQAITHKSRRILYLKVDPRWDPLRSDRRFEARVKRLGL